MVYGRSFLLNPKDSKKTRRNVTFTSLLYNMLIDNKHISIVHVGAYWLDSLTGVDMVWTDKYQKIHAAHLHGDGLVYTWEVLDELVENRKITKDDRDNLLRGIYGRGVELPTRNFGKYDIPDDDFEKSMPGVLPLKMIAAWDW